MDKKIQKKKWTIKRIATISAGMLFVSFVLYNFIFADKRSKLNVELEKITVATVKNGSFQEFIPVTGNILPSQTYYLDAIEGGIVKRIVRESGAMVEKGDVIMELSNSNLQLNVLTQESQLYEQINNLRQTRLLLDQNDLTQQAQLAEIDYQLGLLKPQYERFKQLFEKKLISQREFEEVAENYEYNVKRRKLTYTSYRNDSINRVFQLRQLRDSENRMMRSLEGVGNIMDNMVVRAPSAGQLSAPQLEIGQSVNVGQRLGQVDGLDSFKARVSIDELYLPRVDIGQTGTFDFAGGNYKLQITKVYPTITDGRFEVDMEFVGEVPSGIRRGQTLRIRLELGNPGQALLLPMGGFYQETGGNWVFVLNEDGSSASRKSIRLGRKNPEYFEVLDGLSPGERVITSSYTNFGDNEVLVLK
ncbi:HlyD family efflux transporter periplasmic adaptor subunit [Cytophagales bacterium LB-30]|uniref:HlyD family efflux transporter periplasmic adaptor subunit n=1 Tax=Shiella aurantiaca TaxID=3058365 RepID=A0ABT8F448_9BACT|nr:HlyD family efflux transporter periplasmic adaptor subunit [Shiella aurantiaca]MDN4165044.1 HlyD family efflux transporter periplasmic adaptor subunit [Shiella aurantiaca]